MTAWEPATEAEVAMRDALRANDQELYFRLLSRTDVLLPVSAPAQPGQPPTGWGTWTTAGRTHVLAFTSTSALRACLGDNAGSTRRVPFTDLASGWPNQEWWLAVNPGLPVEGYLPAWFVSQLSRGDVRLPGRAMGARARLERAETLARSRPGAAHRETTVAAGSPPPTAPASFAPDPVGPPAAVPPAAVPPAAVPPAAVPPAAVPPRGPAPGPVSRAGTPSTPWTPSAAEPSRRSGVEDQPGAAQRHPTGPTRPGSGAVPRTGRPSRFTPLASNGPAADQPGAGWPAAQRPGEGDATANGGPQQTGRRSFFEPNPVRDRVAEPAPGGRLADRATPPSRFARGSQPFPRRRPADAPADDSATRAFPMTDPDATRPIRPPAGDLGASHGLRAPAAEDEVTQPLPPRRHNPLAEEATRAFRVPGEPAPVQPSGQPTSPAEETQATPQDRSRRFEPVDDLPASVAEPVSGPPAPRRGFTPIVIEGTIIESRDLADLTGSNGSAATPREPSPADAAPPPFGATTSAPPPFGAAPSAPPSLDATSTAPPSFGAAPSAPPSFGEAPSAPPSFGEVSAAPPSFGAGSTPPPSFGEVSAAPPSFGTSPSGPDLFTPSSDVPGRPAPSPYVPYTPPHAGRSDGVRPDDPLDTLVGAAGADSVTDTGKPAEPPPAEPAPAEFEPANTVEEDLLAAAGSGSTDTFLSTLLLARVLLPAAPDSARGSRPGDSGFVWQTAQLDGETYVVVYTSPERLADHIDGDVDTVRVKFAQLIRRWPDEDWSFAVNPGTPVGAKLPGEQIVALANWAAEVGLGDDLEVDQEAPPPAAEPAVRPRYAPAAVDPTRPTVMQKAIAPSQLAYYLDRGYDRVSGFVHRAGELAHLTTPAQLHDALGLNYPGSPFAPDAEEIYVLRWPAHRPSLYRIPYGGQNEPAMRAMEGWVIERPPFRGNGFAPGESSDVVAEFKVDSARLPHGARLWRIGADGTERVVAELDTDTVVWRRVGEA
ncbi:SseB family protein [Micromonospora sp. WMMD1120]|uniref:SseB family protein n=1 Tax=Micromonospora sp. WMMD1120 TaxID=3016106 RepID=UPI00241687E3|nr:SseB family protein [Micromonospora sp. WMMD1120]MDG4807345.1 SseB family protein [Micromonospora sp. WMMD1120]